MRAYVTVGTSVSLIVETMRAYVTVGTSVSLIVETLIKI